MIKDEYIEVKITKRNIKHFSYFYKDIKLKDIIKVDPVKLQENSNKIINVCCDVCKLERSIKYQAYYKNIKSSKKYPIYTCDKCSHIKIKETNLKKFGVEYYSQTDEYNGKFKSTMLERWGVEYSMQSEELKEKAKETNLKKFGVENPFMDNKRIRKKFKEIWGVDHPSKVQSILEKSRKTMLENWGFEYSLQCPEIKDKIYKTNKLRYDNSSFMKSNYNSSDISNNKNYLKYLGDNLSLLSCDKGHDFSIKSDLYHNRKRSNIPLCTVCYPISKTPSIKEEELFSFIKSIFKGELIQSYRDGLEIDIYVPDLKLGFEFNGLYWHSEKYKKRDYHYKKSNYFSDKGIRIIHIWEDDWVFKNDIIKSQIKNWLGISKEVKYARKCQVVQLKPKECNSFLNENHLQGSDKSKVKIGLLLNGELVSVMTFNKNEGRINMPNYEWNLSRFCNKKDTIVVGGASKLLSFFIKNYNTKRIISYADADWSDGNLYKNLGFDLINLSLPDYKYIIDNKRVNKSRFRRSYLNTDMSESLFMKESQIQRIWDSGKLKFEKFYR